MRFKRPSVEDGYFDTPPGERPDIDLSLSGVPHTLPMQHWDIDTGVTRWFDLVYGFALDVAVRQGYEVSRVNEALDMGDLVVRSFFYPLGRGQSPRDYSVKYGLSDAQATYIGAVEATDSLLYVSGGSRLQPPAGVAYQRGPEHDGEFRYMPLTTQVVRPLAGRLESEILRVPFIGPVRYDPDRVYSPLAMPDELWAAYSMGTMADVVRFHLNVGAMAIRARVVSVGPEGQALEGF